MKTVPVSYSSLPSLLAPLTSRAIFRDAVEVGATRYAETKYQHQTNVLTYQAGDGMGCHGWFNRGFSEKFARSARRSGKRVYFVVKKKKDVHYIGDVVFVKNFNGQTRFDASLEDKRYTFLHMTGQVDPHNKTLEVYKVGKARTEYLKNQSSRVVKVASPDLFNLEFNDFSLIVDDDRATRIIIVTQVSRLKDRLEVWACIPTSTFDSDTGVIQLSELEKICEKPITNKRATVNVTPKPEVEKDADHGIIVTPKRAA